MVPAGRGGGNPTAAPGGVATGFFGTNRATLSFVENAGTRASARSSNGRTAHGLRSLTSLRERRRIHRPEGMATARAARRAGG
jgi:hypothetical protein